MTIFPSAENIVPVRRFVAYIYIYIYICYVIYTVCVIFLCDEGR